MPTYDRYPQELVERRVYKYFDTLGTLASLRNATLRWSRPGRFNDPFDMQFDLSVEVDTEELRLEVIRQLFNFYSSEANYVDARNAASVAIGLLRMAMPGMDRKAFEAEVGPGVEASIAGLPGALARLNTSVRDELVSSKILCLTDKFDSVLMWSHYANNHRGAVLGFRNVPDLDSPYVMARPVVYQEVLPALVSFEQLAGMLSGGWTFKGEGVSEKFMYTKSADWAYERELRIVSGHGRNKDADFEDLKFGAQELASVFFGVNADQDFIRDTLAILDEMYPHVISFQGLRASHGFSLEFRPLQR